MTRFAAPLHYSLSWLQKARTGANYAASFHGKGRFSVFTHRRFGEMFTGASQKSPLAWRGSVPLSWGRMYCRFVVLSQPAAIASCARRHTVAGDSVISVAIWSHLVTPFSTNWRK